MLPARVVGQFLWFLVTYVTHTDFTNIIKCLNMELKYGIKDLSLQKIRNFHLGSFAPKSLGALS